MSSIDKLVEKENIILPSFKSGDFNSQNRFSNYSITGSNFDNYFSAPILSVNSDNYKKELLPAYMLAKPDEFKLLKDMYPSSGIIVSSSSDRSSSSSSNYSSSSK